MRVALALTEVKASQNVNVSEKKILYLKNKAELF